MFFGRGVDTAGAVVSEPEVVVVGVEVLLGEMYTQVVVLVGEQVVAH